MNEPPASVEFVTLSDSMRSAASPLPNNIRKHEIYLDNYNQVNLLSKLAKWMPQI
jgi:hypothetical protein